MAETNEAPISNDPISNDPISNDLISNDLISIVEQRLKAAGDVKLARGREGELVVLDDEPNRNVIILEHREDDQHTIVILARVCSEKKASARDVLRLAHKAGLGAVALIKDTYVIRLAVGIDQVDTAPFSELVAYALQRADIVRSILESPEPVDSLFSW